MRHTNGLVLPRVKTFESDQRSILVVLEYVSAAVSCKGYETARPYCTKRAMLFDGTRDINNILENNAPELDQRCR
jgi:hypothetical protein